MAAIPSLFTFDKDVGLHTFRQTSKVNQISEQVNREGGPPHVWITVGQNLLNMGRLAGADSVKFPSDKDFVLNLLHEEHVLLVHGSGFSPVHGSGHFRLVALPPEDVLNDAFDRIDRFMRAHP